MIQKPLRPLFHRFSWGIIGFSFLQSSPALTSTLAKNGDGVDSAAGDGATPSETSAGPAKADQRQVNAQQSFRLHLEPIRDFQHYTQIKSLLSARLAELGTLKEQVFRHGSSVLILVPSQDEPKSEPLSPERLIQILESTQLPNLSGRPQRERLQVKNAKEFTFHPITPSPFSVAETPVEPIIHVAIVE